MSRLWSPRGLCAAILLLSREVTVARRDSSKCLPDYIGDGDCDAENNRLGKSYAQSPRRAAVYLVRGVFFASSMLILMA